MTDNERLWGYEFGDVGTAAFVPRCPICGRFVAPDRETVCVRLDQIGTAENATCAKCGRVCMPFMGWF